MESFSLDPEEEEGEEEWEEEFEEMKLKAYHDEVLFPGEGGAFDFDQNSGTGGNPFPRILEYGFS